METILLHIRKLRVDWLMFGALIGLMIFGGTFVLSAAIEQYEMEPLLDTYFFRQLVFYGLGLPLAVLFVVVDYHRLAGWSRAAYWVMILLLILVLIPGIGEVRHAPSANRVEAFQKMVDESTST